MSVRNRFFVAGSFLLVAALLLPAFVYAQQGRVNPQGSGGGVASDTSARNARSRMTPAAMDVEQDVSEAISVIQENYVDGKKLDYNSIFKSSITGMLRALDPHSTYFDAKEFEEFRTEQRSEYTGIGATIGDLREGDQVNTYIRATFQNSPAARAGLRFGDRIAEVDGQSMRNKTYPEVREHLLGPRGTVVKVTVEHSATGKLETVEITRDAVPQPSIPEAYMLRPGVGYIAMTGGFNTTTMNEFQIALDDLHSKGMNMLVLDLRGNRGGLLIQAVRVANTFLQRGQLIVSQKGRVRGSSESFVAQNDNPDTTPLVVLINHGTASAAEILAGAMQDHDRALIVGETSFGKGLVQLPFNLSYDSALLLTIAKYYTPSGRLIQRDYSNGGFYDYYTRGGTMALDRKDDENKPSGPESKTDTGRPVYGGGGISPDEASKPRTISTSQARLRNPIFAFTRDLINGRVNGFDSYKVTRGIDFEHDKLQSSDFPTTEELFKAFKEYVTKNPSWKMTAQQIDHSRSFLELELSFNMITAAFGRVTADQVLNADDPQVAKAIDMMPKARELAMAAMSKRNQP